MIVRRCSQGHRVRVHRNTTPGATRVKTYADGTTETLAYPSAYTYFVDVDGKVAKKTNSFKTAEEYYVDECKKVHSDSHGRVIIGKHQLIGGIGAASTLGTLDWNHSTNARSGSGATLLLGTATNGPSGSQYFHSFCFLYGSSGNMTQWAIGYSTNHRYQRNYYASTWSSWSAF